MTRFNRPSHATIVAYLALFTALAGGAYAVQKAEKNSVVSKSIKNNQVKSKDLKDNGVKGKDVKDGQIGSADVTDQSLTPADLADNSLADIDVTGDALTGKSIDESSLLGVDAETLDGLNAECPAGTRLFLGGCWETASRTPATYPAAAAACATAGGELPHPNSLLAFNLVDGVTLAATDEWSSLYDDADGVGPFDAHSHIVVSNANEIKGDNAQVDAKGYRCIVPLLR